MSEAANKLRRRDHALIMLGLVSAAIIIWLLLRRRVASPDVVNNISGPITFPNYTSNYTFDPGDINIGGNTYGPIDIPPLIYPSDHVPVELCGCGCNNEPVSDYNIPTPPTYIISNPVPTPPVYSIISPPPAYKPSHKWGQTYG